ncbi:hypothetical protein HZU73_04833 [Apis mellifera caucasica]|nr:hypothetical protein HZU73_04833 [Apis mellifera caucasica]KAG9435950.1 hypothetical protein HZU67_02373 [Apis mellifera carnica]
MTHMTEVNFGDFQMEERYKKLERTLKLASLRKENRKKDESTLRAPSKWTVILNEQNLLIIKGKIECGIIAWSKPIIRRLTSTKIECVCKHLYHLQGNIVDNKCELPDYVRDDIEPKLLSDWTPRVLFKSGLNLIFEGNLLNEIGHIVRRKFKTDKIYRRVSGKLVETIHHEFYQLVGNLRDTKHVIPKKLLRKCRYGCPVNIEQFCKEWESLQNSIDIVDYEDIKKCNDISMDNINVGRSSKGRRIIPPLTYWTGERIIMKDNNPVYKPGTIQDNNNRINNSLEYVNKNSLKMLMGNTENIVKKIKNNKSKKFPTKNTKKTRISESSNSSNDHNISVYEDEIEKITSNSINISNKQNLKPINIENSHESCTNVTKTKTAVKKSKVRKNVESNTSFLGTSKQMHGSHQSSVERYRDIVCMYYQGIPNKDDILSDDQVSHV